MFKGAQEQWQFLGKEVQDTEATLHHERLAAKFTWKSRLLTLAADPGAIANLVAIPKLRPWCLHYRPSPPTVVVHRLNRFHRFHRFQLRCLW